MTSSMEEDHGHVVIGYGCCAAVFWVGVLVGALIW